MFMVIICLFGVSLLLILSETLSHYKLVGPELKRKIFHSGSGTFIAFWPWLLGWHAIAWIGLGMLAVTSINGILPNKIFDFSRDIGRVTYGEGFLALAIIICALFTDHKIIFALAILQVSLADSAAAIIGQQYGKPWHYKVFHQPKTIIGSMSFWFVSTCVLGFGLLFAHDFVSFNNYLLLVIALPPVLAVIENISPDGLDNLSVPLATVLVLNSLH